jgi:hypothetical protein
MESLRDGSVHRHAVESAVDSQAPSTERSLPARWEEYPAGEEDEDVGYLRDRPKASRPTRSARKSGPLALAAVVAVPTATKKQFKYGFGNELSQQESDELHEKWTIPSPARPLFEAAIANFAPRSPAKVDV